MIEQGMIRDWLTSLELRSDAEEARPPVLWHLAATFPRDGMPVHLLCGPPEGELLAIQRTTTVADEHRRVLQRMEAGNRRDFNFQLTLDLLRMKVQYALEFADTDVLASFTVGVTLWRETLSRQVFFDTLQAVHSSTIIGIGYIQHAAQR